MADTLNKKYLKTLRVLLVENDEEQFVDIIELLEVVFKDVYYAKNKDEGIEVFKKIRPDIVFSDLRLRDKSGLDFAKSIKKLAHQTPIILFSDYSDPGMLIDAIDAGIEGYIQKPVSLNALYKKIITVSRGILQHKELLDTLHLLDEYKKVIHNTSIYSKTDKYGNITFANMAFCNISGYDYRELIGKNHRIVRHPSNPASMYAEMWNTIKQGKIWKGVIKNKRKDGGEYVVSSTIIPIIERDGNILEFVSVRYDITDMTNTNIYLQDIANENEKIAEQKQKDYINLLHHDDNTGLLNVLSLQEDVLDYSEGTLILLDINNFNIFNKLHGFNFGDKILKETALHLNTLISPNEKLYKLSADRFAILTTKVDEHYLNSLTDLIYAFFDTNEITIDTIDNQITFSAGIANIEDGRDTIIDAEFALDISKQHGKRFKLFYNRESERIIKEIEGISWLKRTRDFILKDMIVPYYQPIVDIRSGEIYKYEALARVIDGDNVIQPESFLNAANRLGLLSSVTKSMINKTFKHFSGTDTQFSINITERDIIDGYLVEFIKLKCEKFCVNPTNVTFEILENITLSKEGDFITQTISLVKDYGCKIAIDDFGSENSNFSRILSLQSDYIKIDGAFIAGCDTDLEKQKIISAIIQLANTLGIKCIAEYVSSKEIYETIKKLGVDYAQGYYFGMPSPVTK